MKGEVRGGGCAPIQRARLLSWFRQRVETLSLIPCRSSLAAEGRKNQTKQKKKLTRASFICALFGTVPRLHTLIGSGRKKCDLARSPVWSCPAQKKTKKKNSFLLPDAKLFQESKCRVLKDILTATVEHSLPLTSAMIKMLSKMQHCRAPSPGECATSHLSMNRRLSGCQRKW